MKIKCKDCEAFHKDKTSEHVGYCCRRPPVLTQDRSGFPRTSVNAWCMEGIKKQEPSPIGFRFSDGPNGEVFCTDIYAEGE